MNQFMPHALTVEIKFILCQQIICSQFAMIGLINQTVIACNFSLQKIASEIVDVMLLLKFVAV
jgi:hypothetical protein